MPSPSIPAPSSQPPTTSATIPEPSKPSKRGANLATRSPLSVQRALSTGEELFWTHCQCYGLTPEREYQFADGRKYRFDFAWPGHKVAVEIDGGTAFGKSRHSRGIGYESDCRKINLAARHEWLVFRFTTQMVVSGEAIDLIREVLT